MNFEKDIVTSYKEIVISFSKDIDPDAHLVGIIIINLYNNFISIPTLSKFMIDSTNTLGIVSSNILNIYKKLPIMYLFNKYLNELTIIKNIKKNTRDCGIFYDIKENNEEKLYTLKDIDCFMIDSENIQFIEPPKYANKHFLFKSRKMNKESRSRSILFSTNADISEKIQDELINKYKDIYTKDLFNFEYENGEILSGKSDLQYQKPFNIIGLKKSNEYIIKIYINLFADIDNNIYFNYILYILDIINQIFFERVDNIKREIKNHEIEKNKFSLNKNCNYDIIEINDFADIAIESAINITNGDPGSENTKFLKSKNKEHSTEIIKIKFSKILDSIKESIKQLK
jgi:hypothetical protein